jgi:periplasmic divalent cation tolerance protein
MAGSAKESAQTAYVAFVSCPQGKGREIARELVNERLAACINIIPAITSVYFWEGQIQEDGEELMVIKTTADAWQNLQARIKSLHPYDLPEMIYFPIEGGYEPYLNWLRSCVRSQETVGG